MAAQEAPEAKVESLIEMTLKYAPYRRAGAEPKSPNRGSTRKNKFF